MKNAELTQLYGFVNVKKEEKKNRVYRFDLFYLSFDTVSGFWVLRENEVTKSALLS